MGSTALKIAQLGTQTVFATAVAATAKMMGVTDVSGKPEFTNLQKRYMQGDYAPAHGARITDKRASAVLNGDFSFEDFLYVLESSVKGGVTPTGTPDKTWDYPFPLTASPNVKQRTIEIYDGTQEYDIVGAVCSDWALSGAASNDGLVMFTSNWVGRDFVPDTLTPALANRSVETLPVGALALFIDDLGGTIGTTAKTSTLIDFSLTYNPGIHMKKFAGDADVRPTTFGYGVPQVQLSVTYESNAAAHVEIAKYAAGTGRLIRLRGTGSLITGAIFKTLQVDFAGDILSVDSLWGDRDGNSTIKMTLGARLDTATFGNYGKIQVINSVSTLP
jgi:hypothetical protein